MGILPETFWDSSLCEIVDIIESHIRREEHKENKRYWMILSWQKYMVFMLPSLCGGGGKEDRSRGIYPDFFGKEKEKLSKKQNRKKHWKNTGKKEKNIFLNLTDGATSEAGGR